MVGGLGAPHTPSCGDSVTNMGTQGLSSGPPTPGSGRHKQNRPGQMLPASPNLQICFAKAETVDVSSNPVQNHPRLSVRATRKTDGCAGNLFAVGICNH